MSVTLALLSYVRGHTDREFAFTAYRPSVKYTDRYVVTSELKWCRAHRASVVSVYRLESPRPQRVLNFNKLCIKY